MRPLTGKELIALTTPELQIQNDRASIQRAVNRAITEGNIDQADFIAGADTAEAIDYAGEKQSIMKEERKEQRGRIKLNKSLASLLMGKSKKTITQSEIEQRLDGLTHEQKQSMKEVLNGADEADVQDAIDNGLHKLLKKKKGTSVTKAELEKIINDATRLV